jgi:hypothetical protein
MALWGDKDDAASVPKYLTDAEKADAYFIDTVEAALEANRDKGLRTGGWNLYDTYTDAGGVTRHRVESLVAMNRTAAEAGDLGNELILATGTVLGTEYVIISTGDTDFTAIGAADSDPGTVFTATGAGTGTGTVQATAGDDAVVADS